MTVGLSSRRRERFIATTSTPLRSVVLMAPCTIIPPAKTFGPSITCSGRPVRNTRSDNTTSLIISTSKLPDGGTHWIRLTEDYVASQRYPINTIYKQRLRLLPKDDALETYYNAYLYIRHKAPCCDLGTLTEHPDGVEGALATYDLGLPEVDAGGEHLIEVHSINETIHLRWKSRICYFTQQ